jgi:hypothetical protein
MKQYGLRAMLCGAGLLGLAVSACGDMDASEMSDDDLGSTSSALTSTGFTMSGAYYTDGVFSTSCSSLYRKDIVGYEPAEAGKYPLFIYVTGTTMNFKGPEAMAITNEMAKRGFVAATVDYANSTYPTTCSRMHTRASCIFNPNSANSAVTKLCARAKADCSRGIVVAGFSQGANITALSRNYDSRVKGAYLLGHGNNASGFINVSGCANDPYTTLLPSSLDQRRERSVLRRHLERCSQSGAGRQRRELLHQQHVPAVEWQRLAHSAQQ